MENAKIETFKCNILGDFRSNSVIRQVNFNKTKIEKILFQKVWFEPLWNPSSTNPTFLQFMLQKRTVFENRSKGIMYLYLITY